MIDAQDIEHGPDRRVGVRPIGVRQDALRALPALEGIDDRHVIRVGDALEPMVLADHDVAWEEGAARVDGHELPATHHEVVREASPSEVLDRVGDGVEAHCRSPLR